MTKVSIANLLFIAVVLSSCREDFEPAHKLTKTRILAIQAEPPSPAIGEKTTLRPLFYVKENDQVTRIRWSFCPILGMSIDGYACPLDQANFDAIWAGLGIGSAPSLDLGEGDVGIFTNPFPAEILAALCSNTINTSGAVSAGQNVQVFNCTHGYPILVRMVATTTAGEITAVTELAMPIDAISPANQNPVVGPVRILNLGSEVTLDDAGTIIVPRNVDVSFDLAIDESASETYRGRLKDAEGKYIKDAFGDVGEDINIAWYAEGGSFGERNQSNSRSGYHPGAKDENDQLIPFSNVRQMVWRTPKIIDDPKSQMRLIAVIRDSRGGVAWQMLRVGLEATP